MLTKEVLSTFVNGVIPRETFTKMGVEPNFVSTSAASPKADQVQNGSRDFCHEGESFSIQVILGSLD
jgi:hypothetical protein